MGADIPLERTGDVTWRIPRHGDMRVDGLVFASEDMMSGIRHDPCLEQVRNVACLPGIVGQSMAMPDIHWGYGFPIGGVAAFDPEADGVVSPGGVGYDINCGVRLLRSNLSRADVEPRLEKLMDALFANVPSGVGSKGLKHLSENELRRVLARGASWAVENGFGDAADVAHIEEGGALPGADPEAVSARAMERGRLQLGSLGSGNHFLEVDVVDEIFDRGAAGAMGLFEQQAVVLIHTGSRGLGHQTCEDHLETMLAASRRHHIALPDRQLACAPLSSPEAKRYLAAMGAAVNFAFANRQMIAHRVREAFEAVMEKSWRSMDMRLVYDVAHNIAKMEEHAVEGRRRRLCVHRKGATRAFPPGHPGVPEAYRAVGQPVLIPGDMGRYSFVLAGTQGSFEKTFGSTCHGAGRLMSRHQAKKTAWGRRIFDEMRRRGVILRAESAATVAEEIPEAYKDVAGVVDAVVAAGLSRKVARLRPIGVAKG
jgi:tRNA-splicing ligase RtcB